MSIFDWVIIAVFVLSILIGFARGFIKEALSIIAWLLALWLAVSYCVTAGDFIAQKISIPVPALRTGVGFAVVFIGTLLLFSLIGFLLSKLLSSDAIKGVDRVLGIGLGAARAAAIVVAVLLVARGFGMESADWWKNSKYLPRFIPLADAVEPLLPSQWQRTEVGEEQDENTQESAELAP